MDMHLIRNWQFAAMRNSIKSFAYILDITPHGEMRNYRDGGDGWTALEALCHLRDYEEIFFQRFRVTLEQGNPDLPNADPDQLAIERKYNEQDVIEVYHKWEHTRAEFLTFLESIPDEAWERAGKHSRRGMTTLNEQLVKIPWHDLLHLEQMTRTLEERRVSIR